MDRLRRWLARSFLRGLFFVVFVCTLVHFAISLPMRAYGVRGWYGSFPDAMVSAFAMSLALWFAGLFRPARS